MSFIVKGFDLPKKGELHLIISKNGTICGAEYPNKIRHLYPLNLEAEAKQIPKGHGRIGDLDELAKHMKRNNPQTSKIKWASIVTECAPTILEAEE